MSTCGRPTKSGHPCCNPLSMFEAACRVHRTDTDVAVGALLREAWQSGWESGVASGRQSAEWKHASAARAAADAAAFRLRDHEGQLVTVDGHYTYRWTGSDPLEVGDYAVAPGNWFDSHRRIVKVTALGSSYHGGPITNLLSRASEDEAVAS